MKYGTKGRAAEVDIFDKAVWTVITQVPFKVPVHQGQIDPFGCRETDTSRCIKVLIINEQTYIMNL